MTQTHEDLKTLRDGALVDELAIAKHILSLCVYGALNDDYEESPEGLYWAKENVISIADELADRLLNKNRKTETQ